jgi:hypothetical protein
MNARQILEAFTWPPTIVSFVVSAIVIASP